jgi:hypothetical protein
MVVNSSVPAKTVSEFIAYAKANPGRINMGSAGIGSAGHLAGELFKMMAAVSLVHVPYRGNAPALTDLIAGQVEVLFPSAASSLEYVKTGKMRGLAVTGAVRLETLPDVPTVGDTIPGYEASSLYGIGAPRNMAVEIVDKLNKEVNAALADPKMRARLADLGGTPLPGSSADFGKLIADETEKWGKVISPPASSRSETATGPIFRNARLANGGKDRCWHETGWSGRARPLCPVIQTSTCSAMARASSTSMPRYLTVLSILVWPSRSCTARRLPVRR